MEVEGVGKAKVPSWIIAPPRFVGAWSKSSKSGNIAKITRRAGYGGIGIHEKTIAKGCGLFTVI